MTFRNVRSPAQAFVFANGRDLMPAKHGIDMARWHPYHQAAIPILPVLFPSDKAPRSFRECWQSAFIPPAVLSGEPCWNEWVDQRYLLLQCHTQTQNLPLFFFSCTGKALLMWFLSKKSLLFFFPGIYFLESYHIISPHNVTIPFLFILRRTSLILSGGLALSAGQLGGWGIFFSQFTASVCGNVTNLIPSIQQIFILKRKIISVSIFKQIDCFINTKTKI